MKKILITGACGFAGHHFVEYFLNKTDYFIYTLDSINYAACGNRLAKVIKEKDYKRIKFLYHDLKSPINDFLKEYLKEVSYVCHLAAESHVDRSLENSIPFVTSNVLGTANLLEFFKNNHTNLNTFIYQSTDEVFGPALPGINYKETDIFRPSNPYAATKAGAALLCYSFAHAFKFPVKMVNCTNLVGEGQHPEKFVPKVIECLKNKKIIPIHGTKELIGSRKWLYVKNLADVHNFLFTKGDIGEYYNVEGNVELNNLEVANIICNSIFNRDLKETEYKFIDFHSCRPGHDIRYSLDDSKLKNMGWTYKYDVIKHLKEFVKREYE